MLKAATAAQQLGISQRAVYDIPLVRLPRHHFGRGRGAVRYAPEDVEAYKKACRSAGTPETSAGATNLTASLKGAGIDLAAYFRAAGVKPRLTPTTAKNPRTSTPLRLASNNESR